MTLGGKNCRRAVRNRKPPAHEVTCRLDRTPGRRSHPLARVRWVVPGPVVVQPAPTSCSVSCRRSSCQSVCVVRYRPRASGESDWTLCLTTSRRSPLRRWSRVPAAPLDRVTSCPTEVSQTQVRRPAEVGARGTIEPVTDVSRTESWKGWPWRSRHCTAQGMGCGRVTAAGTGRHGCMLGMAARGDAGTRPLVPVRRKVKVVYMFSAGYGSCRKFVTSQVRVPGSAVDVTWGHLTRRTTSPTPTSGTETTRAYGSA